MYYTDGAISGVSLTDTKRTSPLQKLKNNMLAVANNDKNEVKKGGAGSNGPAIFGDGYGFAAGNSSAQGAYGFGL